MKDDIFLEPVKVATTKCLHKEKCVNKVIGYSHSGIISVYTKIHQCLVVDGIVLKLKDKILLKDEDDSGLSKYANGVYIVDNIVKNDIGSYYYSLIKDNSIEKGSHIIITHGEENQDKIAVAKSSHEFFFREHEEIYLREHKEDKKLVKENKEVKMKEAAGDIVWCVEVATTKRLAEADDVFNIKGNFDNSSSIYIGTKEINTLTIDGLKIKNGDKIILAGVHNNAGVYKVKFYGRGIKLVKEKIQHGQRFLILHGNKNANKTFVALKDEKGYFKFIEEKYIDSNGLEMNFGNEGDKTIELKVHKMKTTNIKTKEIDPTGLKLNAGVFGNKISFGDNNVERDKELMLFVDALQELESLKYKWSDSYKSYICKRCYKKLSEGHEPDCRLKRTIESLKKKIKQISNSDEVYAFSPIDGCFRIIKIKVKDNYYDAAKSILNKIMCDLSGYPFEWYITEDSFLKIMLPPKFYFYVKIETKEAVIGCGNYYRYVLGGIKQIKVTSENSIENMEVHFNEPENKEGANNE